MVPSDDWAPLYRSTTPQMMFRAIENGATMARFTVCGRSEVVDPLGNILLEFSTFNFLIFC